MPCGAPAAPMPFPCQFPAMPCRVNSHAAPLPFSDSAVSFVKVRVLAGNIRTASPTVLWIAMLLITTFVQLRVVSGRSRTWAGRPHAVSGQPMLIHTCHAVLMPCRAHATLCCGLEKSLSERHGTCETNTVALCKSNGKDTI
jgi:hypothetical protein